MTKKVEIDESELTQLSTLRNVIGAINKHPKAGVLLEEAHKLVNPEAKTPRLDQLKETTAPVEDLKKQITDLEKRLADKDAENEKNAKLAQLQTKIDAGHAKLRQEGWTEDGLKALDAFREKEGILDPIAAAAYYEKLHGPQVAPVTPSSGIGRWDFTELPEKDEGYAKKLLDTRGDNETLVMQEAMRTLNDIRGKSR